MRVGLYWFRKDLRITDHPLLVRATDECDALILLAVVPQNSWAGEQWGIPRMSERRKVFLIESLQELDEKIKENGGHLHIRLGRAAEEMKDIFAVHRFDSLYYETLPGSEEAEEEADVANWARRQGVEQITGQHQTLTLSSQLPFEIVDLPLVFTSFRIAIEKQNFVRSLAPAVNWKKILVCDLPPSEISPPLVKFDVRASLDFRGGSKRAHQRLHHYIHESGMIAQYKELRNGLTGADFSSKFSPWLANGNLSAVEIYHAIKAFEALHGANDSTYWLVFELLWRDFFHYTAWKEGKRLFHVCGFSSNGQSHHRPNKDSFARWCTGHTGQPFVDAAMRELVATGFMSNRARQNVASYLVHDLGQDWRWGAAFFECHLLDYDVSSNWCNWAYIAGVGNDPRAGRKFNVEKQAKDYDPKKIFIKLWNEA
jgi:deoxyribodipyrimidine photo-lyase